MYEVVDHYSIIKIVIPKRNKVPKKKQTLDCKLLSI